MSAEVLLVTATHVQDLDRFRLLRRSLREVGATERFHHLVALDTEHAEVAAELRREPNLEVVLSNEVLTRSIEHRRAAARFGRTSWRRWARTGSIIPGWYAQQLIKLATLSHAAGAQAVAFFDSDLVVLRPLDLSDFIAPSGKTRFFVDDDMRGDGSDEWNRAAARTLGIDPELVSNRQFIHTPTVFDVKVAAAMLHALAGDGGRNAWQSRMQKANLFEYPTYGTWVTGKGVGEVEDSAPIATVNFVDYADMWDFRERASRVIAEGTAKVLGVQSRLHIPPASYEPIVAQAWR